MMVMAEVGFKPFPFENTSPPGSAYTLLVLHTAQALNAHYFRKLHQCEIGRIVAAGGFIPEEGGAPTLALATTRIVGPSTCYASLFTRLPGFSLARYHFPWWQDNSTPTEQ